MENYIQQDVAYSIRNFC